MDISTDLADTTCRACRSQLGMDQSDNEQGRLAALFVLAITLGLRPGELRALRWDHVNLDKGVISRASVVLLVGQLLTWSDWPGEWCAVPGRIGPVRVGGRRVVHGQTTVR